MTFVVAIYRVVRNHMVRGFIYRMEICTDLPSFMCPTEDQAQAQCDKLQKLIDTLPEGQRKTLVAEYKEALNG